MNNNDSMTPQEADPNLIPDAAADLETVLEEYRRRQMIEHLTGPVISVVLHLVVLVFCLYFLAGEKPAAEVSVTFNTMEIKPKEIEQKQMEKLDEVTEKFNEQVQPVDKPVGDESPDTGTAGGSVADFNDNIPSTADGGEADVVCDVKMGPSALKIAGVYGGRTNAGRMKGLGKYGSGGGGGTGRGMPKTELAVLKALRWLKDHQNEDGSWSNSYPVAMCGLALLAFLAHGELADSKEFGMTVQKALRYLSDRMNGVADGAMVEPHSRGYSHAIATYAVAEAYGMTKNPALKPVMEKGLASIIAGQEACGGWDYSYNKDSSRWDTSLSGWSIQALKAGFLAGSDNSQLADALQKALTFLQKTAFVGGHFQYSSEGNDNRINMQGVGALCLQLLGQPDSNEAKTACKWIKDNITVEWISDKRDTSDLVTHFDPYGWYYETQVMLFAGTSFWTEWEKQFSKELVRNQESDGHWNAPPARGGKPATTNGIDIEPYYATTLCCLMLEAYYRLLPSAKMNLKEDHSDGAKGGVADLLGGGDEKKK